MHKLPKTVHAHHEQLLHEVDRMPAVGYMIGRAPIDELRTSVDGTAAFLTDLLIPHMEAQEAALYGEFERILQNRTPWRPCGGNMPRSEIWWGASKLIATDRTTAVWGPEKGSSCAARSSGCTRCSRSTWPKRSSTCRSSITTQRRSGATS